MALREISIPEALPEIKRTPGLMGGDACIRDTRIPVWMLVQLKQTGSSDEKILAGFPGLTDLDLVAAWAFYTAHPEEIESERRSHDEAA